jgi:uncharacterized protein YdhG (YjbR/CyaY superfamily)
MKDKANAPKDVDVYIAGFPAETQKMLLGLRNAIKKAAPKAEEIISYRMPAYKYHGILVYFAGYKNHIGFYPTSSGIREFKKELSVYKGSKGTVQFPLDKPLPLKLISSITRFRIKENLAKEEMKGRKKII